MCISNWFQEMKLPQDQCLLKLLNLRESITGHQDWQEDLTISLEDSVRVRIQFKIKRESFQVLKIVQRK